MWCGENLGSCVADGCAACGETLESIGVVVVKALLCCGFHVACGDTCAVVKALGFCGKGKCTWWHLGQQQLCGVTGVHTTLNRTWYSRVFMWCGTLVKTIVVLLRYVCGHTWDSGGGVLVWPVYSSRPQSIDFGPARRGCYGVVGIKGWQEERFKSGLGEGRVSPPQ